MTTTITVDERVAQALEVFREQAEARGMSLEGYLTALSRNGGEGQSLAPVSPHSLTTSQFRAWLEDLSASIPPLPPIPADFSRADLYEDHD
jgi:hypothetical protein